MAGSDAIIKNPYVGPRPFDPGERLYGRDREIAGLLQALSAERVVLLYSPSGAGKSSLLNAGLIPRLRRQFDVWRPTRVGHPLPPRVPATVNRYRMSALLGFEQGLPETIRLPPDALAELTLGEYFGVRPRRPGAPNNVLLVFDQFEEVLTTDPLAIAAKRAFFDELGELLQDPTIWALLSLREDYLAALDPYAALIPTHLRHRFRIDLLGLAAAKEAIVGPAVDRAWAPAAVDRLVHDLAMVKLQQPDGSFVEQVGLHVEPVQLQVVCRGLWDRMPADDRVIDEQDVTAFGDVGAALGAYYAAAIRQIAGDDARAERALRTWVSEQLITAEGIRSPVLRTTGGTEVVDAQISRLVDAHLVRAEQRGGATWYELAHDRLVRPVRADNDRWAAQHLEMVQMQAAMWARQGRSPMLLLSTDALTLAERWAAGLPAPPGEPDAAFIAASQAARAQERATQAAQAEAMRAAQALAAAQMQAALRLRRFAWLIGLLGALALAAGGAAYWQYQSAAAQAHGTKR